MEWNLFIKGLIIGLAIAIPVGPIAIIIINRTFEGGKISGIVSGMGSTTADTIYGALAGLGVSFVSDFLHENRLMMRIIGGLLLVLVGARTLVSRPPANKVVPNVKGLIAEYFTTFFLTLSNPVTILAFAAIFAGFGVSINNPTPLNILFLITGLLLGSFTWWMFLVFFVEHFYTRLDSSKIVLINKVSGIIIMIFGIGVLVELVLLGK